MKNLIVLLFVVFGLTAFSQQKHAQQAQKDIVPIDKVQEVGNNWAQMLWGDVYPDEPIPIYSLDDEIIGFMLNFAVGQEFPESRNQFDLCMQSEVDEKRGRWMKDQYGHILMSARYSTIPIVGYQKCISDDYAWHDKVIELATEKLGDDIQHVKNYYMTDLIKWYCYTNGSEKAYVKIFPPAECLSEAEFQEVKKRPEYSKKGMWVIPKDVDKEWSKHTSGNSLKSINTDYLIANEDYTPYNDWSYGCTPTAFAMALAYHDHRSMISSNDYGNLVKYHFHRVDPVPGGSTVNDYNVSDLQEDFADEMGTNAGGGTSPSNWLNGFITETTQRGYSFTGADLYGTSAQYLAWCITETGANRPWHHGTPGHSNTGVGYTSASFIIRHNTWNSGLSYVNYNTCDLVGTIVPGGQTGASIELTAPNGDPGYSHNGDGEIVYSGNVYEVTWDHDTYSNSYCKLYYSTNAGSSWTLFESNTPNDGSYLWTVPSSLNSTQGRLKIKEYSSGGTLIAADGSWGNFSFVTGSSIITLSSDAAQTTTTDPTYYKIYDNHSNWGVAGIRTDDISTSNWSMKFYDSDDFSNEVESSTWATDVDFVVFDQNHLNNTTRGIKTYRVSGSGNARTEFELWTETLSVGTTTTHSWPANDVVEIWDIYLTPGTYKFSMDYNYGSANLDMALFSSYGGPYYQQREDYVAHSTNSGTNDESFFATVSHYDYYGVVVWANDANSANVDILVETTTAGLWEGDVSANWNTAGNWNDNNVPSSTTDVVIPSGTLYSPYIYAAHAYAKTLTVESGATLTIGGYDLDVDNEVHIYGTFAMNHINADLYCFSDIYWESGSQANITANAEFRVYGNWIFGSGANVQMNNGKVWFQGTSTEYIQSYESGCYFNNVYSYKTGGAYFGVSYWSTEDLTINGSLTIYSGSAFNSYSMEKVILNGSMINNGGHFLCNYGTFEFAGTPSVTLKPNVDDYFNNLIINVSSSLGLANNYSDSLVVKGDISISGGNFDCNGLTITCGGDWLNAVGTYGFYEEYAKVIFDGTGYYQYCYGETFYDFTKNSGGSNLLFHGPTDITNDFRCYGHTWAYDDMNIDNLFLNSTGKFVTSYSGTDVVIDDLDMGYTFLGLYWYGTLEVYDGQCTVGDLADPGLYGSFKVSGSTAVLDITQVAGQYIDLNGSIEIVYDGTMDVRGTTSTSYWPYTNNASVTMTSGVLDFHNAPIRIHNSTHTFTTNITGGTIRTPKTFYVYDTYNPAGGTLEFYGTGDPYLSMNHQGSALYNLHVNKTSGELLCNTQSARISNDVIIDGGTLGSADTLYVGGDWTNNVGTYGFYEYYDAVCFYGNQTSDITTDETFYNLVIDKTSTGYADLELLTGLQVNVTNNLHPITGTFEVNDNGIVNIDGDLIIENGAGFNVNDANTTVYLADDFIDYNTTISIYDGFNADISNSFIFDGSVTQTFNVSSSDVVFGYLTLDKGNNSSFYAYDDFRVIGDFEIAAGNFLNSGTHDYYFEGDFTNNSATGDWNDHASTLHFEGGNTEIDMGASNGYFGFVVVDKSSYGYDLLIVDEFRVLGGGSLTINTGEMKTNASHIYVAGSIDINSNGELSLNANSVLTTFSGTLSVNSGGEFYSIGSYGNEVTIQSNYGASADVDIEVNSGGTIGAVYTDFIDMVSQGVYVKSGAVVDTNYPFSHCSFSQGQTGGRFLTLNNTQNFTVEYANFPDNTDVYYNVYKSVNGGDVYFENAIGVFAGETYDYDPYNKVHWTNNINIAGVVTDVSCNGGSDGEIDLTLTGGTPGYTFLWSTGWTNGDIWNLPAGTYTVTVTDYYGAEATAIYTITQPLVYSVYSNIHTDVSCYGGSDGYQSIYISGGTAPDVFIWSNGSTAHYISNVTAGTYTITCTDANGCVATGSYVITQPTSISKSFAKTNVSCYGGSDGAINLTVSGGTPPYTYLWTGGATTQDLTNLTAGTYLVTITDSNSCTSTATQTVTQPAVLNSGYMITLINCYGGNTGAISHWAYGGTSPYSYFWNDGTTTQNRSNLVAGTYTVTSTDNNGCTIVDTYNVTQNAELLVTGTVSHVTVAGGSDGSISTSVSGGTAAYGYLWSTGAVSSSISGLSAGTYS
ncbi:MAG: SprB repeat-containing protein, partial [Bacteroidota bacterium]|nr:SprB repeat-containing protein [Bacteroidota bacterium]